MKKRDRAEIQEELDSIKLNSKIETADDADMAMKRLQFLNMLIAEYGPEYEEEKEALEKKYDDYLLAVDEVKALNKQLEKFAEEDRYVWDGNSLPLDYGVLSYEKSRALSLQIGVETDVLVKNLKEYFKTDPTYYTRFIDVKITPKKTELRDAVASGVLDDAFCENNQIKLAPNEKFAVTLK